MKIEKEKDPDFEVAEGVDLESTDVDLELPDVGFGSADVNDEQEDLQKEAPEKNEELNAEESPAEDESGSDDSAEVEEYGKKVQKRISKLTAKLRESERREQAALGYAQGVQSKLNKSQENAHRNENQLFSEYGNRIDSELEQAKTSYKQAYELGDVDALVEANQELARLSVEQENMGRVRTKREQTPIPVPREVPQELQKPARSAPPAPDPDAEKWAEDNEWFGSNKVMTGAAMMIHRDLIEQGIDTKSKVYYNNLNEQMRESFPHKFETPAKPAQQVAGAVRSSKSGRTTKVKLTQSEVAIANKLGVPLEQYAKYKQA